MRHGMRSKIIKSVTLITYVKGIINMSNVILSLFLKYVVSFNHIDT